MEENEIPLRFIQRSLKSPTIFKENASYERKDISKMFIKHLHSMKTQSGLCLLLKDKNKRNVSSNILHSRINQDYEKLYDMSPGRKKKKLQNARILYPSNIIRSTPDKSHTNIDSLEKINQLVQKTAQKKKMLNKNFKSLLPKLKKTEN